MFSDLQRMHLRVLLAAGLCAATSFSTAWATSAFTAVDAPGAGTSTQQGTVITATNAAGDVTGIYTDSSNVVHGFVLPAGGTISTFNVSGAGTGAGQGTMPASINSSGVTAGTYTDSNNAAHGFVRAANGTITAFDAPGAPTTTKDRGTSALSINDSGVIVGFYSTGTYNTDSVYHGFQRLATSPYTITNIDAPNAGSGDGPGFKQGTFAYGINASGEIVGSYTDSNFEHHGFLLSGTTYTVIDAPGVGLATCINSHGKNFGGTTAGSIDAAGDVGGHFLDTNCAQHGFVRSASGAIASIDAPGADPSPCSPIAGAGDGICGTAFLGLATDSVGDFTGGYVGSDGTIHSFLRPAATGIITTFSDPSAAATGSLAGTLGASIASTASGITIVGAYSDANSVLHGFIFVPVLAATTTTLSPVPTPNPSIYGEPVTLSATVSSSAGTPPNGESVWFMSGATQLGSGQLSGGTASLTTTALLGGTDPITAVYGGDANFSGSTSTAVSQTVNQATSTTTLNSSPNPSSFAEQVKLMATVTGQLGGIATGTVTFKNGTTTLGSAPLSGGSAVFAFTALPQGTDSITAVYNGDLNFAGSTSNPLSQVVGAEVLGDWTWMGGNKSIGNNGGQPGVYGSLGAPAAGNIPGSRQIGATWTDNNGNLWLFGGWGYDSTGTQAEQLNDFWEFNPSTNLWSWMAGSSTVGGSGGEPGVYGNLGSPAAGNIPGSRAAASQWKDSSGNLWLFGGSGFDVNSNFFVLNDLWKFNPSTNQWEWVSGSEYVGQSGVYGTLGTPSSSNVPGSRYGASSWIDSSGNLWLFGGLGKDSTGATNWLNDVWEFNPSTSQWTWMGGSKTIGTNCGTYGCGQPGVYGTPATPAANNIPGSRKFATSWTDSSGNFWLFGGFGNDANNAEGWLNDLWMLNPSTNQWTWMSGSSTVGASGGHGGEYCTPGSCMPGGRQYGASWTDGSGNLWLFGGEGLDGSGSYGFMNDLWEFYPSTSEWAWIGGSSAGNRSGVYGTLAVPAAGDIAGGRGYATAWTDSSGNFWVFGGNGYDGGGAHGDLNDLWEYRTHAPTPKVSVTPSALSITAAQALTVTVAVSGGNGNPTPTGTVKLTSGSYTSATVTLSSGGATFHIPAGSLNASIDLLSVSYVPDSASSSAYSAAFGGATVNVTGTTSQTITFPAIPTPQVAATSLGLSATASSGLTVTYVSTTPSVCSVSGATASLLISGTCTIEAMQAGSSTYSAAPAVYRAFWVNPAHQTITFPAIATQTVLTSVGLSATASSGLTVSFASTTPSVCTVAAGATTASLLTSGTCTIHATQAGNTTYSAAPAVNESFTVVGLAQTVTFPTIASQYAATKVSLTATASSGLTVTYTSTTPTVCTVAAGASTASLLISGTCTLAANQAGNSTYAAAPAVYRAFWVNPAHQTITFPTIPAQVALTSIPLSATASSGLAVSFASTTPTICTVSGTTASLLIPGTCTIQATQAGNTTYSAAPAVNQSFVVKTAQTITFPAIATQYALTSVGLSATASSGLTVSFASTTPTVCTVSGTTASLLASGTCVIQATQAGNSAYGAAPAVSRAFWVNPAHQTITFPNPGPQTGVPSLSLSATASSGLTVSFASTTPTVCTVSGATASLLIGGTCTIQATQAGNATYAAAPAVNQSFTLTAP